MTPLQKAAQAVIDRWDSPAWKDQPHTAEYIEELRKALDAEIVQSVEPVAWVRFARKKPTVTSLSFFSDLTPLQKAHGFVSTPLCHCHPPQPQAKTAVPDLLKEFKNVMSWIDNWSPEFSYDPDWPDDRDKARSAIAAAQGEKP